MLIFFKILVPTNYNEKRCQVNYSNFINWEGVFYVTLLWKLNALGVSFYTKMQNDLSHYFLDFIRRLGSIFFTWHFTMLEKMLLRPWIGYFNTLSANPTKWSNTLKQLVGNSRLIVWVCFDHFLGLALEGITFLELMKSSLWRFEPGFTFSLKNILTNFYKTKFDQYKISSFLVTYVWSNM